MLNAHQISERLAVSAGVSLLAALVVPTAVARPFDDGGGAIVEPQGNPAGVDAASAGGFDWGAVLVAAVVIGLAVLVLANAVHYAARRRDSQFAAR